MGNASMGPQLYRCGNASEGSSGSIFCSRLQWGRNFIVAEMLGSWKRSLKVTALQWGRNFIVAEMSPRFHCSSISMTSLQWGRNFIVAETHTVAPAAGAALPPLQWGRNFIVAEIKCSQLRRLAVM